jgi:hypothetical protein
MSASHTPIDLDALQDAIAHQPPVAPAIEAAADGSGHAALGSQSEGVEVPAKPQASPPVPHLGAEAAANMTKLAKAAAQDIRQLGQLAFDAGKRVQEECEEMARDVEANGGTVAVHLTGLSQLLAEVGSSNRDTLRRLVGGLPPSMVPPADEDQVAEQPGGMDNATHTAPLSRGHGIRIPGWLRS